MKRISCMFALSIISWGSTAFAQSTSPQLDWSFMKAAPVVAPAPMSNNNTGAPVNSNLNVKPSNNRVGTNVINNIRDGWEHVLVPPCGFNNDRNKWGNPPYDWQERERHWQERETYLRRLSEHNQQVSKIVNDRQDAQIDVLYEGVKDNKISREEFLAIMVDNKSIRQLEESYTQDGLWTQDEFNIIMRELDKVDQKLRRYKRAGWGSNSN